MISTKFASFFYGIVIASVTWGFSLYLYSRLSRNDINTTTIFATDVPNFIKKSIFDRNFGLKLNTSNTIGKFYNDIVRNDVFYSNSKYKNSEKLLQQLKAVPVKSAIKLGNGILHFFLFKYLIENKFSFFHSCLSLQGLDELGMVKNAEEQRKREDGYKNYAFNVLVSDNLDLQRKIPDTRNELCSNLTYDNDLPTASIVICFYNEHYNTLIRSLYSIMNRTPKNLLHEIILINDLSDHDRLHEKVKEFVDKHFDNKIKYYKMDKREGLIRARIFGARKATGDVIVFLDSHVEVNNVWIEPLLSRIVFSKKIVPVPVIDIINADTFQYTPSPLVRGGFNWGMHFKWDSLPADTLINREDFVKPIK